MISRRVLSLALGLLVFLMVLLPMPLEAQTCTDGDIRFKNGNNGDQIEVCHSDRWKGVCDDRSQSFRGNNARVACRHLGYGRIIR